MFDWLKGLNRSAEEKRDERLSAYIDGTLSSRERQKLERELQQDARLRAELHDLQRTVKMLRSLPTLPLPRHFTLDPAVYGRVKPRRLYLYPVMRAATVLTSLLFVFLFVSDLFFASGRVAAPMAEETDWAEPSEVAVQEYMAAEEEVAEEAMAAKEAAEMEVAETEVEVEVVTEAEAPATTVVEAEVGVENRGADTMATAPAEQAGESDAAVEEEGVVEVEAPREPLAATEPATVAVAPLPTAAAEEAEMGAAAGDQAPTPSPVAPSPMPLVIDPTGTPIPTPSTAPSPTLAEQIPADEAAPEPARAEPFDWWPLIRWGMGGLALALLAITLLARRFNW